MSIETSTTIDWNNGAPIVTGDEDLHHRIRVVDGGLVIDLEDSGLFMPYDRTLQITAAEGQTFRVTMNVQGNVDMQVNSAIKVPAGVEFHLYSEGDLNLGGHVFQGLGSGSSANVRLVAKGNLSLGQYGSVRIMAAEGGGKLTLMSCGGNVAIQGLVYTGYWWGDAAQTNLIAPKGQVVVDTQTQTPLTARGRATLQKSGSYQPPRGVQIHSGGGEAGVIRLHAADDVRVLGLPTRAADRAADRAAVFLSPKTGVVGGEIAVNGDHVTLQDRAVYSGAGIASVNVVAESNLNLSNAPGEVVIEGGHQNLRSHSGSITLTTDSLVTGLSNTFTACTGLNLAGTVQPAATTATDCSTSRPEIQADPAPVFSGEPTTTVDEEATWTYEPIINDSENRLVTLTVTQKPAAMDVIDGVLTWTTTAVDAGVYDITLEAVSECHTVIQAFQLTVEDTVNQPPVLSPLTPEAAHVCDTWTLQLSAVDPEGDDLTFTVTGAPAGMTQNGDTLTWTPSQDQQGDHNLTITVIDSAGGSDSAVLSLSVQAAQTTTITSQAPTTADEGALYTYTPALSVPAGRTALMTLSTAPEGMTLNNGTLEWTPGPTAEGDYNVAILVEDGCTAITQTFSIHVNDTVNLPPVLDTNPPLTVHACGLYHYNPGAVDPDGDTVTWTLLEGPEDMLAEAHGHLHWFPGVEDIGPVNIHVIGEDGRGGRVDHIYTFTVLPPEGSAPVISQTDPATILTGDTFLVAPVATDADGDVITAQLIQAPQGVTLSDGPILSWTPTVDQTGDFTIDFTVSDGCQTVPGSISIHVDPRITNEPPFITSTPQLDAYAGYTYTYPATAEDPDNDPLEWSLLQGPGGMAIDADTGILTWTPSEDTLAKHDPNNPGGGDEEEPGPGSDNPIPNGEAPRDILILKTTIQPNGPELRALARLGYSYDIVEANVWRNMTTEQFAAYRAIVFGDPDTTDRTRLDVAVETVHIWGPAVNGNVLIFGGDPNSHGEPARILTENAIRFAADDPHGTGCYIALSEYYHNTEPNTPVPVLNAFAPESSDPFPFTATGVGCYNDITLVASHPALDSLTDEALSGWGCSVHEAFDKWPDDFQVLGLAENIGSYFTAPDGRVGTPYILARGKGLRIITNLDMHPVRRQIRVGENLTVTVGATENEAPAINTTVTLTVLEGPNRGLVLTSVTDDQGVAHFNMNCDQPGTDIIEASFYDSLDRRQYSDRGEYDWVPVSYEPVRISVTDNISGSDEQDFTLTVWPNTRFAPGRFLTQPPLTARDGELWHYHPQAVDVEGNPVPVRLDKGPLGMYMEEDGGLSWTPLPEQRGPIAVALAIGEEETTQWFVIQVEPGENEAPVFYSQPETTHVDYHTYIYTLNVQDPERDAFTLELLEAPTGMNLQQSSKRITWIPRLNQAGEFPVTLRATDEYGLVSEQTFTIELRLNQGPQILSSPTTTATPGVRWDYYLVTSDPDGDSVYARIISGPSGMVASPSRIYWTPTEADLGEHEVVLGFRDSAQAEVTQTFTLVVSDNTPPTITSSAPNTNAARYGFAWTYQMTATDPDGDTFTWSLDQAPQNMTIDSQTGLLTWDPIPEISEALINVLVTDEHGGMSNRVYMLHPSQNEAPQFTSPPQSHLFQADRQGTFSVTASDPNPAETLTYELIDAPEGVRLISRTILWTAPPEMAGHHYFTIIVTDPFGETDTLPLHIEVNRPPVFTGGLPDTAEEGELYIGQLTGEDPDGNPYFFEKVTTSSRFANMTVDPMTGDVRWTPSPEDEGNRSIYFRIYDTKGGETRAFFNIRVEDTVNAPPRLTREPRSTIAEGSHYHEYIYFTDPDNDPMTRTLNQGPEGMIVSNGFLDWTPDNDDAGEYPISYTVDDGRGGVVTHEWILTVTEAVNTPPVFLSTAPTQANAGHLYQYAVLTQDADNDQVTLSLEEGPTGMSINGNILSWLPQTTGDFNVRIAADDARENGIVEQTFTITVGQDDNTPPVFTSAPVTQVFKGAPYRYTVLAEDADGDALTFALIQGPADMTIDPISGLVQWMSHVTGDVSVVLSVTDILGATAQQVYTLTVDDFWQPDAAIEEGMIWLVAQQNENGAIARENDLTLDVMATLSAASALTHGAFPGWDRSNALAFLSVNTQPNTEHLARLAIMGETELNGETLSDLIQAARCGVTGYGDNANYQPTAYDTAWALTAMNHLGGAPATTIAETINFLDTVKQADGGFALSPDESDLYTTAITLAALAPHAGNAQADAMITNARSYLNSQRREDGLWGETFLSAVAFQAMFQTAAQATDETHTAVALTTRRDAAGSYNQDVFETGQVLSALAAYSAQLPVQSGLQATDEPATRSGRSAAAPQGPTVVGAGAHTAATIQTPQATRYTNTNRTEPPQIHQDDGLILDTVTDIAIVAGRLQIQGETALTHHINFVQDDQLKWHARLTVPGELVLANRIRFYGFASVSLEADHLVIAPTGALTVVRTPRFELKTQGDLIIDGMLMPGDAAMDLITRDGDLRLGPTGSIVGLATTGDARQWRLLAETGDLIIEGAIQGDFNEKVTRDLALIALEGNLELTADNQTGIYMNGQAPGRIDLIAGAAAKLVNNATDGMAAVIHTGTTAQVSLFAGILETEGAVFADVFTDNLDLSLTTRWSMNAEETKVNKLSMRPFLSDQPTGEQHWVPTRIQIGETFTYRPFDDTVAVLVLLDGPEGMQVDRQNGALNWTPGPDQMGAADLTFAILTGNDTLIQTAVLQITD